MRCCCRLGPACSPLLLCPVQQCTLHTQHRGSNIAQPIAVGFVDHHSMTRACKMCSAAVTRHQTTLDRRQHRCHSCRYTSVPATAVVYTVKQLNQNDVHRLLLLLLLLGLLVNPFIASAFGSPMLSVVYSVQGPAMFVSVQLAPNGVRFFKSSI